MEKYIFDFDGTLVDSMRQWSGKMINVLKQNNIDYPVDIIKTITPLGDIGAANYFRDTLHLDLPVNDIIAQMDAFAIYDYSYIIPAKDTVVHTLKELKKRGHSLNVLTASPHRMLDVCLKRLEIFDIFDNVWSCEDFGTTKSDVNIYIRAAEKLCTTVENCVFLDDNINALITAEKAGMQIVGVYDESAVDFEADIKKLCEKYIYKFSELL